MDIEIGEVVANVKAVDGASVASPEVMRRMVTAVLRAVEDRAQHDARVAAERRVTGGVSQERDAEN